MTGVQTCALPILGSLFISLDLKLGVLLPATDTSCKTGYIGQLVVTGDEGSTAIGSFVLHVCPAFTVDSPVILQGLQSPVKPYSTSSTIRLTNVQSVNDYTFAISAPTDDGGKWLVVNPPALTQALPPGESTTFSVSADLTALPNTKSGFVCQRFQGQVLFTDPDAGTAATQVTLVLGAARVTKIAGDVTVTHQDNTVTTGPLVSLLQDYDTISTAPNSSVTLLLPDGSKMILKPSSTLAISELCTTDGVAQIRTNLQAGGVTAQVNQNQTTPPDIGVDTPGGYSRIERRFSRCQLCSIGRCDR